MLEKIIAKALETEIEAASRINLSQSQCVVEENKASKIAQDAITECKNHLRQDLFQFIEIQEKNNTKKLKLYVSEQEEELKSFLPTHNAKIHQISQSICDLICTSILGSGENLPDA